MNNRYFSLILFLALLICPACSEQKEAGTSALTRPLPSAPSPTLDPRATDLKRVVKGTTAPDFALEAPDGETYKLSSFRDKKFVVLVFYRGYFWTGCQEQLGKLKTLLTPAEKQNVQLLAISLDTHQESRVMAEEIAKYPGQLDYPLLTDLEHRVVDAYGLSNPAEFKPGIPYPSVYVIGKDGVVLERFLDESGTRATNEQVREMLKAAGAVS